MVEEMKSLMECVQLMNEKTTLVFKAIPLKSYQKQNVPGIQYRNQLEALDALEDSVFDILGKLDAFQELICWLKTYPFPHHA